MGELLDPVGRARTERVGGAGSAGRGGIAPWPLAIVVAIVTGCGPVVPSRDATAPSGTPTSLPASHTPSVPAIDPGVARLVWLVDRAGGLGVWTTDLAGGDVRGYAAGLDEAGVTIRDARPAGEDVVVIREAPTAATAELWVMSRSAPPRLLLDGVASFVVSGDREVIAVRDAEDVRGIWRVPLDGTSPSTIAQLPVPDHGPQVGPFGLAISPDGQTVAAGWVGSRVEVIGPAPASHRDIGAPLVVGDDGRIVAVTGRAGEAYVLDGEGPVELAPPDSDPLTMPRSGSVAWGSVGEDGALDAVEVRDLLAGTSETYPAHGAATNVVELGPDHVLLEATAFDPLTRNVGVVDRRDGRFATFQAAAPRGD